MTRRQLAICQRQFNDLPRLGVQPFEDDEADSGGEARGNEAEALALAMQEEAITDVKSFTKASSRAAVAATAAATAVAVTKVRLVHIASLLPSNLVCLPANNMGMFGVLGSEAIYLDAHESIH